MYVCVLGFGERWGIIEIAKTSAEIIRANLKRGNATKDTLAAPVVQGTVQFNENSNPGED